MYTSLQELREAELILEDGSPLGARIAPFQRERFAAWDTGDRTYCESCVGSSKTTDLAGWCISHLLTEPASWEGRIFAVDSDQGRQLLRAANGFILRNPRLAAWGLTVGRDFIRCESRGTAFYVESSDTASAQGLLADCVVLEQLESWPKEDLWESIISRAGKRRMRVVNIANAPYSVDDWQNKIRSEAATGARWTWLSVTAAEVPWITSEFLEEQRRTLRPATFERLFFNVIGGPENSFLTPEQVDAIEILPGPATTRPGDVVRVVLGLDLGLNHDLTALTALGERADGTQVLLDLQAWQGSKSAPVSIEEVEAAVLALWERFAPEALVFDPWQLAGSSQRLEGRVRTEPFTFSAKSVSELTSQIWRRCTARKIEVYKGAAALLRKGELWDLSRELRSVVCHEGAYGDKLEVRGAGTKDRLISVAMASHHLARTFTTGSWSAGW